jgi:dihydroneopterin aldolase
MRIHIEGLSFDTIIGVLPHERTTPQRVVIDALIDYAYGEGEYLDYAVVCELFETHMRTKRFELLEEALLSLGELLEKHFPSVMFYRLKIAKPDILSHATVAVSIEKNSN